MKPVRIVLLMTALVLVGVVLWTSLGPRRHTQRWMQSCEPALPITASPPPAGSSPMAALEKAAAALKKSLAKVSSSPSPEHDILRGSFDFEEFVRRALAQHCAAIDPERRSAFVGMFREVLVRMVSKDIQDHPNHDLRFTRETISGSEATVEATLELSDEGKKTPVAMEYKLLYKGDRWLVYDVVTDKQSMLENYKAKLDRIIANDGFEVVFRRTKKRLEKTE